MRRYRELLETKDEPVAPEYDHSVTGHLAMAHEILVGNGMTHAPAEGSSGHLYGSEDEGRSKLDAVKRDLTAVGWEERHTADDSFRSTTFHHPDHPTHYIWLSHVRTPGFHASWAHFKQKKAQA